MHREYKRFLLKREVASLLNDLETNEVACKIFFTKIKLCRAVKYEHCGGNRVRVKESGAQHTQTITYKYITEKRYRSKKRAKIGKTLHLTKYLFKTDTCMVSVEAYGRALKGLYILTIPVNCSDLLQSLLRSGSLFEKYIESEVTEDPRYEQKYLALFGNPVKHPYNIYTIFKDLENRRLVKPQKVIFKEMKSADAVRIFLYDQYLLFSRYADETQKSENEVKSVYIQAFREEIKRTLAIMKSYEEIFDEDRHRRIYMHLNMLLDTTKTYHDLMLIYRKFSQLNRILQSPYITHLLENLKIKLAHEEHKIANYFSSREFSIILTQFHLFVKEKQHSYSNYESQLPFGYSARIKVHNRHSELLQAINFLEGCNDQKSYEKLQTGFEELLDFISIFESQINSDACKPLMKEVARLYKLLRKYERRNKYLLIMKMLQSHLDKKRHSKEIKYIKKIEEKLKHKQKKFDKVIFRRLNHFKESAI